MVPLICTNLRNLKSHDRHLMDFEPPGKSYFGFLSTWTTVRQVCLGVSPGILASGQERVQLCGDTVHCTRA